MEKLRLVYDASGSSCKEPFPAFSVLRSSWPYIELRLPFQCSFNQQHLSLRTCERTSSRSPHTCHRQGRPVRECCIVFRSVDSTAEEMRQVTPHDAFSLWGIGRLGVSTALLFLPLAAQSVVLFALCKIQKSMHVEAIMNLRSALGHTQAPRSSSLGEKMVVCVVHAYETMRFKHRSSAAHRCERTPCFLAYARLDR